MVCQKCGAVLNDGAMFCGYCGAKQSETPAEPATEVLEQENVTVQEEVIPEEVSQAEEVPVVEEPVVEEPFVVAEEPILKKKKSSKGKVIAIIAVILVVLGALAVVFWDQVQNKVENTVATMMPAEKQLQMAYKNSAEQWTEGSGKWITEFKKGKMQTAGAAEGQLAVKVDDDILTQLLGMELDGLNKASLDYAFAMNKDDVMLQLILNLADEKIVSANGIIDLEEGSMAIQVPELSDQALETEFDTDMYNESMDETYQMIEQIQDMLPSGDYAEQFLPKYMEILFGAIEEADRDKETIEVGDVSQKVTVITTEIDEDVIDKMGDALLDELKNDADFKKSMKDLYNGAAELSGEEFGSFNDFYDEFFNGLKDAFAELEDIEFVREGFELVTWINGDNEVVGIQVDEYLRIASAQSKEKVAYEFCAMEDGDELGKVLIEGTKKKEVFEGTIDIYAEEEKVFTVDVDKYISTKDEFACVVSADIPDELVYQIVGSSIPGKVSVKFELSGDKDSGAIKLGVSLGGKELVAIELSADVPKDALDLEYPSDAADDPDTWSMSLNPEKLMENLEKAGLSQDVLGTLIQNIGSMMY